jgi:AcrR family transcriptional regulator
METMTQEQNPAELLPTHRRTVSPERPSAARDRILETADNLFYAHGLQAVGVDRIITEAGVTRVTFYRHFASKDELVSAYLSQRGGRLRTRVAEASEVYALDPRGLLTFLAVSLVRDSESSVFRGCEFVNAAAEITSDNHPVQRQGIDQRKWLVDVAAEALGALGHPDPHRLARKLMMLRTGASMVLGLDPYEDTRELFLETWQAMIDAELSPAHAVALNGQ